MASIFISYRRDDSAAYAGRIYDSLCAHFGTAQVFMDVDNIRLGHDFVKVLDDTEKNCAALVVVIGRTWLTLCSANGDSRLKDPQDFVRREIMAGLRSGMRLFPVLVGASVMPQPKDLPEDLAPLAHLHALTIHDEAFHRDVDQLAAALSEVVFTPPISNLAGTWHATVKYGWGDTHEEVFHFEVDDDELLGTATYVRVARPIQDGKVTGNKITFQTKSITMLGDKTYEEKHQYSGKFVDGQIKFRLQTETGYDSRLPETFTAIRESV